jgi:ferrous iron transport protein A
LVDRSATLSATEPEIRPGEIRLGEGRLGLRGVVARVAAEPELERRLLEMGFVEGATVALLNEGPIGRDPIAVRLDDMKVALRRREARAVWVRSA